MGRSDGKQLNIGFVLGVLGLDCVEPTSLLYIINYTN